MDDAHVARDLVTRARHAALATIGLRPAGHPFASLVAVAADERGRPLLLLSRLAEHTKNLEASAKASLLVSDGDAPAPLSAARVTLLGTCALVPDADVEAVRARYLAAHPDAKQWASFADFAFYRLEPEELRVVVGFGRMSWVSAGDYAKLG